MRESGESPMWYAPVPHESMFEMRGCAGLLVGRVMDWKTPSDIVERQMLPRQTKRTETGLGEVESLMLTRLDTVVLRAGVVLESSTIVRKHSYR